MKKPTTKQTKKQKLINASVRRSNKAYRRASPAGRRVLIAKDALKQIKKKKYEVSYGDFARYDSIQCNLNLIGDETVQLQPLLHDPRAPSCEVCGIGSLFLSAVRMRNDCLIGDFTGPQGSAVLSLLKEFSETQRELIEMAFEKGDGWFRLGNNTIRDGDGKRWPVTKAHRAAIDWADNFLPEDATIKGYGDKARLVILLNNIIRNKGTFKPTER